MQDVSRRRNPRRQLERLYAPGRAVFASRRRVKHREAARHLHAKGVGALVAFHEPLPRPKLRVLAVREKERSLEAALRKTVKERRHRRQAIAAAVVAVRRAVDVEGTAQHMDHHQGPHHRRVAALLGHRDAAAAEPPLHATQHSGLQAVGPGVSRRNRYLVHGHRLGVGLAVLALKPHDVALSERLVHGQVERVLAVGGNDGEHRHAGTVHELQLQGGVGHAKARGHAPDRFHGARRRHAAAFVVLGRTGEGDGVEVGVRRVDAQGRRPDEREAAEVRPEGLGGGGLDRLEQPRPRGVALPRHRGHVGNHVLDAELRRRLPAEAEGGRQVRGRVAAVVAEVSRRAGHGASVGDRHRRRRRRRWRSSLGRASPGVLELRGGGRRRRQV
mmetsp:Transcript_127432/g.366514  ORF Transcript_127432/g.366514 Transcript_127432/m.366514 type:complete len:387 (+) Transcript_127432:827-1987(+)